MTLKQINHTWLMLLPLQPHRSSPLSLNTPSLLYTFAHAVPSACNTPHPLLCVINSSNSTVRLKCHFPLQTSTASRQRLLLSWALSALTPPLGTGSSWAGIGVWCPRRLWLTKHVPGIHSELSKWTQELWGGMLVPVSLPLLSPKLK